MTTALAVPETRERHAAPAERKSFTVADIEAMADYVSRSGLFPGVATKQAAFSLMMLCQADGLHPMTALKRYHIIEGRPSMRADAMQAEFQSRGGFIRWLKYGDEEAEAVFGHRVHCPEGITVRATLEEFVKGGTATTWDKDQKKVVLKKNWKTSSGAMLRARLISRGVRMVDPGAIVGTYTPEEVADFEPYGGETEALPAPPAPAGQPAPFHQNGSGHGRGSYPSQADEEKYGRAINKFVAQFNAAFLDKWQERGEVVEGVKEPINWHSVNNALIHEALKMEDAGLDPGIVVEDLKTRQKEAYNALAFTRCPDAFKAALVAYAKDKAVRVVREWRAKHPGLTPECLGFEELMEDEADVDLPEDPPDEPGSDG